MDNAPDTADRLWRTARFLPQSVRLLGARYRELFAAHARQCRPRGEAAPIADALAFADYTLSQDRLALLDNERRALRGDARTLSRRFRLRRHGQEIEAVEKWKILQWIGI